jgi:dienelactone hydrolase
MSGALFLGFSAAMAAAKTPLNATVTFYGIPPMSEALTNLPKSTPVQAYLGALDGLVGFSDPINVAKLAKEWYVLQEINFRDTAIQTDGGIHSHGLHKDEACVISYEGKGHAFMADEEVMIAKATSLGMVGAGDKEIQGKVWASVFTFFRKHLRKSECFDRKVSIK